MPRRLQPWIPLLALGLLLAGGAVAATLTAEDGAGPAHEQERPDITFDPHAPGGTPIRETRPLYAASGPDSTGLIPVPQPSTAVLLLVGLAGLALVAGDGSREG